MPIIVVPALHKCGIHMAVSTSGEQNALSVITQVWSPYIMKKVGFTFSFVKIFDDNTVSMLQMLVNVLFFHTEKNDSFSLTGLHHQFEPNKLLVHCEYHFAFCSWPFAFLTNNIYIYINYSNFLLSNFPPHQLIIKEKVGRVSMQRPMQFKEWGQRSLIKPRSASVDWWFNTVLFFSSTLFLK